MIRRVRICIWRGGFFIFWVHAFLGAVFFVSYSLGRFLRAVFFGSFSSSRFFVSFSSSVFVSFFFFVPFSSFRFLRPLLLTVLFVRLGFFLPGGLALLTLFFWLVTLGYH
jgi:hypothetical protein